MKGKFSHQGSKDSKKVKGGFSHRHRRTKADEKHKHFLGKVKGFKKG